MRNPGPGLTPVFILLISPFKLIRKHLLSKRFWKAGILARFQCLVFISAHGIGSCGNDGHWGLNNNIPVVAVIPSMPGIFRSIRKHKGQHFERYVNYVTFSQNYVTISAGKDRNFII